MMTLGITGTVWETAAELLRGSRKGSGGMVIPVGQTLWVEEEGRRITEKLWSLTTRLGGGGSTGIPWRHSRSRPTPEPDSAGPSGPIHAPYMPGRGRLSGARPGAP